MYNVKPVIISASRRTDIPAFGGQWFCDGLLAGNVSVTHPTKGYTTVVSLRPEDVHALVFWTKNARSFLAVVRSIVDRYNVIFNYTITGYGSTLEPNVPDLCMTLETVRQLSRILSPDRINWRYDPIIILDRFDSQWHIDNFSRLCKALQGHVRRCYFKFMVPYPKVTYRLHKQGYATRSIPIDAQQALAARLAEIATQHGISSHACASDHLLIPGLIQKAHCIDGDQIDSLFGHTTQHALAPTRQGCGCVHSIDIGSYTLCRHGCLYCYARPG